MKHAGFDLTELKATKFQELLKLIGASETPERFPWDTENPIKDEQGRTKLGWHWAGKEVLLVTGVDPMTSEHYSYGKRDDWFNYLSYVGISGKAKSVKAVCDFINKHSDPKGFNPTEREYI